MDFGLERLEQALDRLHFALLPPVQADPRREAIRRSLMADLFKVKLSGACVVAVAALVYLLTLSDIAYIATGLVGVGLLHWLAFVWARPYLAAGRTARQSRAPAAARTMRPAPAGN